MLLETTKLIIRKLRSEDLEDFHAYRSDPKVARYQGFEIMDRKEAQLFIEAQKGKELGQIKDWIQFGLIQKEQKNLIGDCAIKLSGHNMKVAEIGLSLNPSEQKKGFAKEALLGLINFLFQEKDVLRIEEIVDVENLDAIKVLETVGFKREGHFVENVFFNGKWGSEYQYAFLKKEWET